MSFPSQKTIIAHRGTTHWAPEETEAAMRWARNSGADYLEFDLQRTKDGYLIALHDATLLRTTDVAKKFENRKNAPISNFTYDELLTLDAGSWFNVAYPDRARSSFIGQDILTLADILHIAEGKRIKRDGHGKRLLLRNDKGKWETVYEKDPADNGNRPGIYPETKVPSLFPGIEQDLKKELENAGWYHEDARKLKSIEVFPHKIGVANMPERVILQTFSKESLAALHRVFVSPIPTCFLLWRGQEMGDIPDDQLDTFAQWIRYGKEQGATIIGPSIGGAPNQYADLLDSARVDIIRKAGLKIHAYTFDTEAQFLAYSRLCDGIFSNDVQSALHFYTANSTRNSDTEASITLKTLGYER